MEDDLVKELEQLEIEKQSVNANVDLSKECSSIVELNNRISLLVEQIKSLRTGNEEHGHLLSKLCDNLSTPCKSLKRTSELFDLSAELTKLNRLCRRYDTIKTFYNVAINHLNNNVSTNLSGRKSSLTIRDESGCKLLNENNDYDSLAPQILEVAENFEISYKPLENILTQRVDLPYVHYANNIRSLKVALDAYHGDASHT